MKLEGRFRPNLASNPAGLSYPPTLHKPLPLPSKTLYPWWGSRVELNKGQGRSAVTPGLPLPITSLEGGYRSFKGFNPFVTGVKKICDITVKERDKVVDPDVECANKGVNPLFRQETGRRLKGIDDLLLVDDNVRLGFGGAGRHGWRGRRG